MRSIPRGVGEFGVVTRSKWLGCAEDILSSLKIIFSEVGVFYCPELYRAF